MIFDSKQKKKQNILTGQRPHKKKSSKFITMGIKFFALVVLFSSVILTWNKFNIISAPQKSPKHSWDIMFSEQTDQKIQEVEKNNIAHKINFLSSNNNLHAISKKIQNLFLAYYINIIQIRPNLLMITAKLRKPVMTIKIDKLRFLSEDGFIYGEVNNNLERENLPELSGFEQLNLSDIERANESYYQTNPAQIKLIKEAIELSALLSRKNIFLSKIHFIKYRGFSATTREGEIDIYLGRSPFNKRIDRLDDILINLKKEGSTVTRIEIDYDNKAFVRHSSSDPQKL